MSVALSPLGLSQGSNGFGTTGRMSGQ